MKIFENFDLTDYNSYNIKSYCKKAIFPETEADLIKIYKEFDDFKLIGSGHNIILSKSFYDSDFVILNDNYSDTFIDLDNSLIEAEAGISMLKLSEIALNNELTGLEIFYDIPSSLGGAVVMNAGASGEEIKDLVKKVRYLDLKDNKVKERFNSELNFEFRNSFFQKNTDKVVLKVWLQLKKGNFEDIHFKMRDVKEKRWAKQPKDFPNAGSVFKRPKGFYVGAMIDELKLKGLTVGGAKVSEKHGGFIINFDNASGKDIIELINMIKDKVKNKFEVDLEVEQRII